MVRKVNVRRRPKINVPKNCFFCSEKKEPLYTNSDTLRKYLTERGKIIGRDRSGICAKHQRRLAKAVKHARHLALLPFVGQR